MSAFIAWFVAVLVSVAWTLPALAAESSGPRGHYLDSLAFRRLARQDSKGMDFSGGDVIRSLLTARGLDRMGGGEVIRVLNPFSGGQMLKSLDRLSGGDFLDSLDHYKGGEVINVLDRLTGGDLLRSLDNTEGVAVLDALEQARRQRPMAAPKRTLDTLSGMAFGESKRFDSLSGATFGATKRNFDEIDNVGFNGFAYIKRSPHQHRLALAKKGDKSAEEGEHAGFGGFHKRNFDEIDRTGFEGFEKRKE